MTRLFLVLAVASLFLSTRAFAQSIQLVDAFPNLTFDTPVLLTNANDGSNRVFVVLQRGYIKVFQNDSAATSAATFLDVENKIDFGAEAGLLGLAFHPQFSTNGYFYINYTAYPLKSIVSRFQLVQGNPNKADSLSEYKIIEVALGYGNHNGGMLAFGPDGYLYFGLGDGGGEGDPNNNAQNRARLLGKILRIDVNDTTATRRYRIPPDNPYAGNTQGFKEEIWAYGFRNPWRFSIDFSLNQIWVGDVGQGSREEIDLVRSGGNYGWRIMEGTECYGGGTCDTTGLIMPVKDYGRNPGEAVTGGYVYRGYRRPNLVGAYIYGDYGSGKISMLRYNNDQVTADSLLIDTPYYLSAFGVDQDNELYICTHSFSGSTPIYRFAGNPRPPDDVGDDNHANPSAFRLLQNYPNPFNPSTTISYQLPQNSHAILRVFDMLGREVAVLVDGFQTPGDKEVQFDASSLPSGVYFYRLAAGSFLETRRMVVLK